MQKTIVIRGVLLITLAIVLGAFLAHTLRDSFSLDQMKSFETGVKYQFYTGFFLLILGLNESKFNFPIKRVGNLFFIGGCLFSFSIYLLNLFPASSFTRVLGPITPVGGTLMIAALILFVLKLLKTHKG